jgi:hypothetical protein
MTDFTRSLQRRAFLQRTGLSLGSAALATLWPQVNAQAGGIVRTPHFPVRAKRVIHLCMAGGPSHVEAFDHKPMLRQLHDQPFPESFTKGQQLAQLQGAVLKARGSFTDFKKWGQSGQEISLQFPKIGGIADEICIVRSLHTEQINHDPAHAFMNTGSIIKGRPSMGSWLLYGLGAETEELPGFVVLVSQTGTDQPISARQWSSGFLPSRFQGVQLQSRGDAVHYVGSPAGVCQSAQRQAVDAIQRLNAVHGAETGDPEVATRISQYEMAFQMQTSVPELVDLKQEPQHILDLYGVKQPGDGSFASNCLLARRLAERGVRFIQLYHRGWDHHNDLDNRFPTAAAAVDTASAALVQDLKQRGLLEDTLIIWGGEFGRTPMGQGNGRDHHINAFSIWMAGGGIKPGHSWGHTDELGYKYLTDGQEVHVHDLHATMLHQLGIDHKKLTHRFQGRDFRLTDVHGKIVHGIVA